MRTSRKRLPETMRSAVAASTVRLRATMPPKEATGSPAYARSKAFSRVSAGGAAAGVGVLDYGGGGVGRIRGQRVRWRRRRREGRPDVREGFAVELLGCRDRCTQRGHRRFHRRRRRRPGGEVFAVAGSLPTFFRAREHEREQAGLFGDFFGGVFEIGGGEVGINGGVVGGGAGVGPHGEIEAEAIGGLAVAFRGFVGAEMLEDFFVIGWRR